MADETAPGSGILRKKLFGKIPVIYVLVLFVAILAVVAYKMKNNTASDNTADVPPDAADTSPSDSNVTDDGSLIANPTPTYSNPSTPATGDATQSLDTNQAWLKRAVEWLVSKGTSAGKAQTALQAYLNGNQLSYDQGQIRDAAIAQFGLPPEPFDAGGTTSRPADPARQQGPLPRDHIVKGPNDNTYAKLAQLYYGSGSSANVLFIKAANTPQAPWGNSDGPFAVGARVRIPKFVTPRYFRSTKTVDTLREISSKNGTNDNDILTLNPGMKFPVKPGTNVRVR